LRFWQEFLAGCEVSPDIDEKRLAAKYKLSPGRIKSAILAAAEAVATQRGPITARALDEAILLGNTGRLSEIADLIPVSYGWEDLVLGEASSRMLRDVCNRLKYRHLVEGEWGFGDRRAYGNGISILLYGPPGTGKTMSAQVIAGELGLPIYRINLAQIISKYIGETAKNLDAVFTEAKSSNVILFFDEADALFSKRTDVKSSNDRHANSESSYLLQKIEEYSGISILATNLANNFDEAFRRRIGYMININMPGPEQRLKLWRSVIPQSAPLSPEVDLRILAEHLELSGSVIKSAALQAAYFAADCNSPLGMAHIARAVRQELIKLGKSEPHFLTLYPEI
jgi:SpoVK/Ycf46/Vps4 family AAA+-type ATPase